MQAKKVLAGAFNHLSECRYGYMLYNVNDTYIGGSLDRYGEFSEGEVEVFRQVLQPGNVAVDVGANLGAHTLFFANAVGRYGRVYAFEPQRIIFQTLCANMALNSVTNAYCFPMAVGERAGSIVVPMLDPENVNNFGGLELGQFSEGETVPMITLDSLDLPQCRLIKVDVEGMEVGVLKGARATIDRCRPVLYVENDRAEKADELTRFIDELGYRMYWHRPLLFNPQNFYGNSINVFGRVASYNIFCVHSSENVVMQGFEQLLPGERHPLAKA
jgi:FkbM family methyltransferase